MNQGYSAKKGRAFCCSLSGLNLAFSRPARWASFFQSLGLFFLSLILIFSFFSQAKLLYASDPSAEPGFMPLHLPDREKLPSSSDSFFGPDLNPVSLSTQERLVCSPDSSFPFSLESGAKQSFQAQSSPDWPRLVPQIRQFIETSMKEMGVPGLALAVVHDQKIVLVEGFGFREVSQQIPVTPTTRFVLGSTTKAFTTLAMAMLVDEGKMSWDEPVRTYLPEFALKDEWATLRATPRDLVTHRTGLPRHDLVWSGASLSPEEIVRVLRFLEPSRDFRSAYQYNNLMFITAGVLVSRVAGLPWEDFLKQKIFLPLGMKNSGCTLSEYLSSAEYSLAYSRRGEKFEPIAFPSPEKKIMFGPRASGSVFSTAEDMVRWLLFQLNEGEIEGRRLISRARFREMHTPQIVRPASPEEAPEIEHPSYGLGWMIDAYRGHYRVHHGGSTMGFSSYVVLFPREKFGVAILSNLNSNLPAILCHYISDLALNLPPVDWKKKLSSRAGTPPSPRTAPASEAKPVRPLTDYAGEYIHPAYGLIKIEVDGSKLVFIFREEKIELQPSGPDLFRPKEASFSRYPLRFISNNQGTITSVAIPLEPAVGEIIFVKIKKEN